MTTEAIERRCTELVYASARLLDFRDYEGYTSLFTEQAELDMGRSVTGQAAIFGLCMRRPADLRSRQVISNVFIEVLDDDNARGMNYVTIYEHVGDAALKAGPAPLHGPRVVGHFEDRYTRSAEGWRISRRKLHIAFEAPR